MYQVYDNGGRTVDRYTIYFFETLDGELQPTPIGCVTTDGDPSSFWQHSEVYPEGIGKGEQLIDVTELPKKAQLALLKELQAEE